MTANSTKYFSTCSYRSEQVENCNVGRCQLHRNVCVGGANLLREMSGSAAWICEECVDPCSGWVSDCATTERL